MKVDFTMWLQMTISHLSLIRTRSWERVTILCFFKLQGIISDVIITLEMYLKINAQYQTNVSILTELT